MGIREILNRLGRDEPELIDDLDLADNTELERIEGTQVQTQEQSEEKNRVAVHADKMAGLIKLNNARLDDIRNQIEALRVDEAETIRILQGLNAAHKILEAPMVMPKPYHEARMAS